MLLNMSLSSDMTCEVVGLEYTQMVSDRGWRGCSFETMSDHSWHRLVSVLIWNRVVQFVVQFGGYVNLEYGQIILAQFGGCANLEYGQIIFGTVWWMFQFGIKSNHFWHRLLSLLIWNSVAQFVAQFGGCASLEQV